MAKQKAKSPPAPAGVDPAALPAAARKAAPKREIKSARKGKAPPFAGGAETAAGVVRPKQARKATRKKGAALAGTAVVDSLVAKVFDGMGGALPLIPRPRKPGRTAAVHNRLERLEIAIGEVRLGGRASLRTRKLLASGVPKMAQKVIEEAAEAAIEAIRGNRTPFIEECVDLFYNLVALASEVGVPLAAIWDEMDRREHSLGMAEKLPKATDL